MNNQFEPLLWYNGNSTTNIIPWLASNYTEVSPTQYTFHLRQNITFQDGTPFNAQAVWFSFNRLLMIDGYSGTGTPGSQAAWIVQQMLNRSLSTFFSGPQSHDAAWVQAVLAENFVQIVDPNTVNLNLQHPTTQFPFLLSNEWATIYSPSFVVSHDFPSACASTACPADTINYNAYFDHIAGDGLVKDNYLDLPAQGSKAGTGPYYIDSVNPTTYEVVMKANPNYWGGAPNWSGPPIKVALKELDFLYVPDFATRLLDAKAGKATSIGVSPSDIYSVADRTQWLQNGVLVSTVPGMTLEGPFPQYVTDWFNYLTNVTDSAGNIRKFQPFADIRLRLAVADSVNLTQIDQQVNNNLGQVANNLLPPGIPPTGTEVSTLQPSYSFNPDQVQALMLDAMMHPLTQFTFTNGTAAPAGVFDNTFGCPALNAQGQCASPIPQSIPLVYATGDTVDEAILNQIAGTMNNVSVTYNMGLTVQVTPLPCGQMTSEAFSGQVYAWAEACFGWYDDYPWAMDFLGPILSPGGIYTAPGGWNSQQMGKYWSQAQEANAKGDTTSLVQAINSMSALGNTQVSDIWTFYPEIYMVMTSNVQGFYFNPAIYTTGEPQYFAALY
jgi:ABC-type transport system substrate-binding protein